MEKFNFWEDKTLSDLNDEEWEALCDRCGKCCVIKLIDEDTDKLYYTNISCHLFDIKKCKCKNYNDRKKIVKDCIKLNPKNLDALKWLPNSCSYKLIHEGKNLPIWHPLVQGNRDLMEKGKHSVKNRVISEIKIKTKDIQKYITNWENE